MILLVLACSGGGRAADTRADSASTDTGSPADTAGDTGEDSADTADSGPTPFEPGPDCTGDAYDLVTPFNVLVGHLNEGKADAAEIADVRTIAANWPASHDMAPWNHSVFGPLTSLDGASFSGSRTAVLSPASVGDVALREDGTFVALFVDGDLDALVTAAEAHVAMKNGVVGLGGLAAATSEDGVSWTRADLTFDQPMPPYVVDPEILDTGAGYVLYFLAMDVDELCADTADPFNVPGTHRLLRAESDDLLHWSHVTEAYANPSGGTDPTVWCVDSSRCYGWFSASLVSTDGGATFGPTGDLHLPGTPQIPDVVELDDGSWRMYFLGNSGIELYGSDDGATWKAGGGTGQAAGSPSVLVDAGVLTMWVSGPS